MPEISPPYRQATNRRLAAYWPALLWTLLVVLFIGAMIRMAWHDHQAEARCHRLGGQTYDSGQHCTVGGRTVSTR